MTTYIIIAAVVLLLGFSVWRMRPDITGAEAGELIKEGARLVDVRSADEYSGGGLPKSINIPVGELSTRMAELGDRGKPTVVYCASGSRSAAAKRMLLSAGFSNVHNLGSMHRWG